MKKFDEKEVLVLSDEEKEVVRKFREKKEHEIELQQDRLDQKIILEEKLKRKYSDKELIELGKQVVENEREILINEIFELEN